MEPGVQIITQSPELLEILNYLEKIAPAAQNLLITGESGTGKELIARKIHELRNPPGALVSVNLAGVDDHIVNDMLFGHVKGAFTGAHDSRTGLITKAKNGTLFLDEIGDISQVIQAKLLRLIQFREYYPLGADEVKKANLCIITATNHDLAKMIRNDKFRLDLYYRLSSHMISLPPLRNRSGDIPMLVEQLGHQFSKEMDKDPPTNLAEFSNWISGYDFPGNIRELENILRDLIASQNGDGTLSYEALKTHMRRQTALFTQDLPRPLHTVIKNLSPLPPIEEMEATLISEALSRTENNYTKAAQMLGISRQTLSAKNKRRD